MNGDVYSIIDVGLAGLLGGSLFQDHKWRCNEWSSWHPAFKYIGLGCGFFAEYIDILPFLFLVTKQCHLYQACIYGHIAVLVMFNIVSTLCLLHIYNPHVRWGWCYLHSAMSHCIARALLKYRTKLVAYAFWLDNTTITLPKLYQVRCPNILYIPLVSHAILTADNCLFIEDWLPADGWCEWTHYCIPCAGLLISYQAILILNYKDSYPVTHDLLPAIRITKGFNLYHPDFLKWYFFYIHRMPWKFFNFMSLYNVYELCPFTRTWQPQYPDMSVWQLNNGYWQGYIYAHLADQHLLEDIRPTPYIGTYRYKTPCDSIYTTTF